METIEVKEIKHKGEYRYFLYFKYNSGFNELIKQIKDYSFSKEQRAWHVPAVKENIQLILDLFKDKAWIDLKLTAREEEQKHKIILPELDEEKTLKVNAFKSWMQSRRYSESTIGTYTDSLISFLRFYNHKTIGEIDNQDLINFNNNYIIKKGLSASFQNQVVNAVKLFFRTVENKKLDPELIHRPKTDKLLPNVLSKEEIKLILNVHSNIKHKAMLSLIYSCGLRRSELLNLKLKDIDSNRGLIIVRQAKGKKDRIVPLSAKILVLLRDYFVAYKPKEWLFEGQSGVGQYDERSLQNVLKQALEKGKINKPVSLHWLRHSYATHLLENGTDLRYIQEILGHSRSRTTEIYTHVSNKNIQKIISPFDTL